MSNNNTNRYSKLNLWIINHIRSFLNSVGGLLRTPFASIMTLMVIGVTMALPTGLYILLQNVQHVSQQWQGKPTISLYLKLNTPQIMINQYIQQLQQQSNIARIKYISPQQGLQQFAKQTQFQSVLTELKSNPLPGVLVITPTKDAQSPQAIQSLLQQLKNAPIVNVAQLDMAWVKRLYFIITLGERITYALALLFSIGVILIIGNTIRLTTQHYQHEISVLRLIGATAGFIRRPLLYRGILYGLIGGVIAWVLISLMLWWLENPALALTNSYANHLILRGLDLKTGLLILFVCTLFGYIGSWIAVNKHLRANEII